MKKEIMKNGFIIIDNKQNQFTPYIYFDGSNTSLRENACEFATKEEAENFAESLNGNGNWYSIQEFDMSNNAENIKEAIENEFTHAYGTEVDFETAIESGRVATSEIEAYRLFRSTYGRNADLNKDFIMPLSEMLNNL